jgi:PKD domain-containing protein
VPGADLCTIDRALLPPYAVGGNIGTWITAFRIGNLIYATEPGEAFPEVSVGIRKVFPGADVRIIGMAQDQLGYYYPPETYPWAYINNSDHHLFNASLFLGEANVAAHVSNALALGFAPSVAHETSEFSEPDRATHAGVQFFPLMREHAGRLIRFDARWSGPGITSAAGTGASGPPHRIRWDFGDGAHAFSGEGLVAHQYRRAGSFHVSASVQDPFDGTTITWSQTISIDQIPVARVARSRGYLIPAVDGGQGSVLAAHWRFADGRSANGERIPAPAGAHGTVTVIDGAGNYCTARF